MRDAKSWNLGISKLSAFMQHLPEPNQETVVQYHDIIDRLEGGSGEDFSPFRIPPDKLKPKVLSVTRGAYGGGPGHVNYSKEKYCDSKYFTSQVHGLANYLGTLNVHGDHGENQYEKLLDWQIRDLMVNRKIPPKRILTDRGEQWVYDRAYAIAELMKRDNPQVPSVSNVFNFQGSTIQSSNFVQGSPNATVDQQVGFGKEELQLLLAELKAFVALHDFSPDDRAQIEGDIGTIEMQVATPRPNRSIIKSSLESAKAVIEHAVGTLAAEGIVHAVQHYLLAAGH